MIAADAETLARELFEEYGLTADGWSFRFDSARIRFGCCRRKRNRYTGEYVLQEITLSRALTLANDRATVEDTLRHEIAHALAPVHAGHGPAWVDACKLTGARPVRCYGADVKPASGAWAFRCEGCGVQGTRTRRASAGAYHCTDAALVWSRS